MGNLIVIDGLDGSGKATQSMILCDFLQNNGKKIKKISFPNYESKASEPIKMYLKGELGTNPENVNAYAASSFYAIDRYVSYKKDWEKEYNSGYTIICDRYVTSNIIHQMAKLSKLEWNDFIDWVEDYEYEKLLLPRPNKVIYLDVNLAVSQKLMDNRCRESSVKKDIHELNLKYLIKCREAALHIADKKDWNVIDCCDANGEIYNIEKLSLQIRKVVMD